MIKKYISFWPKPSRMAAASRIWYIFIYIHKRSYVRKSEYPKGTPLEVTPHLYKHLLEVCLSNVGHFSIIPTLVLRDMCLFFPTSTQIHWCSNIYLMINQEEGKNMIENNWRLCFPYWGWRLHVSTLLLIFWRGGGLYFVKYGFGFFCVFSFMLFVLH